MAVETPAISINPYQSNVPVVQMPPEQFGGTTPAPPLPGDFTRKGTGALAIGDSILKGFIQGHQYKAQKKAAEAQATMAAADSATNAAYQKYQDSLAQAGGNVKDPNAQAAYQAYLGVFNQAKQAKAKFVIPEKPKKGDKSKDKDKQGGMFAGIKDFMEANPHIVPQLALLSMQPNPQGMSPDTKEQQQKLQAQQAETDYYSQLNQQAKLKTDAEKTVSQFGGLTDQEWAAMDPKAREGSQAALRNAKAYLETAAGKEKYQIWTDGKGNYTSLPESVNPPPGFQPYQKPTGAQKLYAVGGGKFKWLRPDDPEAQNADPVTLTGEASPGKPAFYVQAYMREHGIKSAEDLTTDDLDRISEQMQHAKTVGGQTTTTTRPGVDYTTSTRSAAPLPSTGRMTPVPPTAQGGGSRAATQPRGAMTPAPGNPSLNRVRMTNQTEDEKANRYQKAKDAYDKTLLKNAKAYADDPAGKQRADQTALDQYNVAAADIEKWYNQRVRAIGGTPGADLIVTLPNGQGTVTFKSKKDADAFKKAANIQ